ncbi:hypothetical protein HH214_08210 [Mucilaginibacter robiniae]|uniref:TonB C-terminal domain-containing protein n=1 Tax=Mucilaginibacter robiniae TaxID=2728022 RepID=A0A7L5E039_9SPHI|nr:hypothetical protein [Mucilaginibacter robiniae]QJD95858.1 hypothetical protein HH214_08210 [Mucilaginibacter robiniae]
MNLKQICILLLLSILSFKAIAQVHNDLNTEQIDERVASCLAKFYQPDNKALKSLCRRGCIFIKFNISTQGKVVNLVFSKDSVTIIQDALVHAIHALEQDNILMNTLRKYKKTYIKPFIYDYQLGCKFDFGGVKAATGNTLLNYYKIRDDMEHYGETIFHMLNFDGKASQAAECLLLTPSRVGAAYD